MPKNCIEDIRAVIFDCDGTIVDSENSHYLAWQHAMRKQGSDLTLEEYYPCVGQSTEADALLFSQKIGKNCAAEIKRDKLAYFHACQAKGIPLDPLIQRVAHVGFIVKDIQKAVEGKKILLHPVYYQGIHMAFIEEEGVPIEFIQQ